MLPLSLDGNDCQIRDYQFSRDHMATCDRREGISAFMRIRNGADFLESTIRSHIHCFDEIVAVYNQCTDDTESILRRLQSEYGNERLRVIHYLDRVYPQGSTGHIETEGSSKHSVVNYSNFALAATRFKTVTKLDDDHLAIGDSLKQTCRQIRSEPSSSDSMRCFSGLNLFRRRDGSLSIVGHDPISGNGDIGFFRISPETYFFHDRRFERFHRGPIRRQFAGFLYWHLKFLKTGKGFGNYELEQNPNSRFMKKRMAMMDREPQSMTINQIADAHRSGVLLRTLANFSEKIRLGVSRGEALLTSFEVDDVELAIRRTVAPEILSHRSTTGLWNALPTKIKAA